MAVQGGGRQRNFPTNQGTAPNFAAVNDGYYKGQGAVSEQNFTVRNLVVADVVDPDLQIYRPPPNPTLGTVAQTQTAFAANRTLYATAAQLRITNPKQLLAQGLPQYDPLPGNVLAYAPHTLANMSDIIGGNYDIVRSNAITDTTGHRQQTFELQRNGFARYYNTYSFTWYPYAAERTSSVPGVGVVQQPIAIGPNAAVGSTRNFQGNTIPAGSTVLVPGASAIVEYYNVSVSSSTPATYSAAAPFPMVVSGTNIVLRPNRGSADGQRKGKVNQFFITNQEFVALGASRRALGISARLPSIERGYTDAQYNGDLLGQDLQFLQYQLCVAAVDEQDDQIQAGNAEAADPYIRDFRWNQLEGPPDVLYARMRSSAAYSKAIAQLVKDNRVIPKVEPDGGIQGGQAPGGGFFSALAGAVGLGGAGAPQPQAGTQAQAQAQQP